MHLSRACAAAVVAALVSTAAAAQQTRTTEPTPRAEETSTGYSIRINSQATAIERAVAAPADSVWAVLPEVLRELGITPQIVGEPEARTMGNQRITARRVAGERTDRFVRCGNQGSGASAVSALRIQLSVLTTVRPVGGGTRLYTQVSGSASPVEGSGGTVHCASTGLLEQKIGAAVAARATHQ